MTINVAVSTFDAIVLGCDSLSSVVQPVMNLARARPAVDGNGQPLRDRNGSIMVALDGECIEHYPVNVFGGVSKMFLLYEDRDTSVAAVTSGQGTVNGRTIAALAAQYKRHCEADKKAFGKVEDVTADFLAFMNAEWVAQPHLQSSSPEVPKIFGTVSFLVGGFGRDEDYGKVFSVDVAENKLSEVFPDDHHSGVTWGGQSNFVERLMRGADSRLEQLVSRNIIEALSAQRTNIVESIIGGLMSAGIEIPDGVNFKFKEVIPPSDPWEKFWAQIDYPNLPVQYAVDLASLLVNIQSGMQHFGSGIATVGGRTHIGVLQRNASFKKLKEPKLAHAHTGYSHEL